MSVGELPTIDLNQIIHNMPYLTIDGDDVGQKIISFYINNDERGLKNISKTVSSLMVEISGFLIGLGFRVLFSAADGVVAHVEERFDFEQIHQQISQLAPDGFTLSAGTGDSLQEAYIALLDAKSSGKNKIVTRHS